MQPQSSTPAKCNRVYWLIVILIFIGGEWTRLSLPLTPFSDPDIRGYLMPSLTQATAGVFTHVDDRNFLYPYFVSQVLHLTGNFNTISLLQHLGGLLSAALMMAVWHQMLRFIPLGAASRIVHRCLGLVILSSFLFASSTLLMEHSIRPEAVFPLFTVLGIFLACRYFIALQENKSATLIFALAFGLVFNACVIYSLKPSFGIGVGVAILPLLISLIRLKWSIAAKSALVAIPFCVAFATLWIPERRLVAQYDKESDCFLSEHLLAIHANIIRVEMDAELNGKAECKFDKSLLKTSLAFIDEELKNPGERYRASLGFDADNLIHKHSLIEALRNYYKADNAGFNQFCLHYYQAAWKHQPGKMLAKVCRQIWNFWGGRFGAFDQGKGGAIIIPEKAARSMQCLNSKITTQPYPPFEQYIAANRSLLASKQQWVQSPIIRIFHSFFNWTYFLWLLMVLTAVISLAWKMPRRFVGDESLDRGILWSAYLFLFNLGNCLTIAIIHTTQVTRYTKNQLIFTLLAEASAILLFSIVLERLRERRLQYPTQSGSVSGKPIIA